MRARRSSSFDRKYFDSLTLSANVRPSISANRATMISMPVGSIMDDFPIRRACTHRNIAEQRGGQPVACTGPLAWLRRSFIRRRGGRQARTLFDGRVRSARSLSVRPSKLEQSNASTMGYACASSVRPASVSTSREAQPGPAPATHDQTSVQEPGR